MALEALTILKVLISFAFVILVTNLANVIRKMKKSRIAKINTFLVV